MMVLAGFFSSWKATIEITNRLCKKPPREEIQMLIGLVGSFVGLISCAAAYSAFGIDKSDSFKNPKYQATHIEESKLDDN